MMFQISLEQGQIMCGLQYPTYSHFQSHRRLAYFHRNSCSTLQQRSDDFLRMIPCHRLQKFVATTQSKNLLIRHSIHNFHLRIDRLNLQMINLKQMIHQRLQSTTEEPFSTNLDCSQSEPVVGQCLRWDYRKGEEILCSTYQASLDGVLKFDYYQHLFFSNLVIVQCA